MLPAHGYPGLKKYAHLAGNFGGAWQEQQKEFPEFPGAIIFNTNCLQRPADSYKDRMFTWGLVRWPGVKHVEGWDFSEVVKKAQECPGLRGEAGQGDPRRLRAQRGPRRGGQGHRRGEEGRHQAVLRRRRLRRREAGAQLLHRAGREEPQGHGDPDAGVREVPVQQARAGRHRRHPAAARRRAVQRHLLRGADRPGAGRTPSSAASTTCRFPSSSPGTSRRRSPSC